MNKSKFQETFNNILPGEIISNWKVLDNKLIIDKAGQFIVNCLCVKCNNTLSYIRASDLLSGRNKQCNICAIRATGKEMHFTYKGVISTVFNNIKKCAKKRHIPFEITIQDVGDLFEKQNGKCALTNLSIKLKNNYKDKSSTASLDRKDSKEGYLKGNIQWVYKDINFMKGSLDQAEFIKLCKLIALNK